MTEATSFAASVLRAGAGIFGSSLLGLAIQVAVARGLGVGAFGVYGFGLAYVALSLVAVTLVARRHRVRVRFDATLLRAHRRALARALGPLMLADGLVQVQMRSAQLILSATSGMAEVGVYSVGRRVVEGLNL